jgi:hypothetical protein
LAHREKILTDNGLPSNGTFTVIDITKPHYPAGENRLTILRIIFTAVAPHSLGIAKDQIYHYLVTNQIHAVEVELLDSLNYLKPSFFPVYPDDPAIAIDECSLTIIYTKVNDVQLSAIGGVERGPKPICQVFDPSVSYFSWPYNVVVC